MSADTETSANDSADDSTDVPADISVDLSTCGSGAEDCCEDPEKLISPPVNDLVKMTADTCMEMEIAVGTMTSIITHKDTHSR